MERDEAAPARSCQATARWSRGAVPVSLRFHSVTTSVKSTKHWASLVVQWLRIRLPVQGTRVRALVWEDPTWQLSLCATTTEPAL